jgi:hypothetical protein
MAVARTRDHFAAATDEEWACTPASRLRRMPCRRRTIGRRMPVTVMATLIGDRHTRREREGLIDVAGNIWK